MSMSLEEFIIAIQKGTIFTITFTKRNSNETRTMNCRYGVEKHLQGGDLPYNPIERGLIVVYDVQKKGYRQIPIEGIVSLVLAGKLYNYDATEKMFKEIW